MAWKKGQAALEFLTTYGWAFLVIIVMIGALAYFGVLSPERFISERCNLGVEFQCSKDTSTMDTAGNLDTRVTYMGTSKVGVHVTELRFNATGSNCAWTGDQLVNQKNYFDFSISGCGTPSEGSKLNGELTIFYYSDATYPKSQQGELVVSVS